MFVLADVDLHDMCVAILCLDVIVDFVKAAIHKCTRNDMNFFCFNKCVHFYVVDAVCDVGIKGNLLLITMGPFDKIILSHSPLPSFFP